MKKNGETTIGDFIFVTGILLFFIIAGFIWFTGELKSRQVELVRTRQAQKIAEKTIAKANAEAREELIEGECELRRLQWKEEHRYELDKARDETEKWKLLLMTTQLKASDKNGEEPVE